MEQIKLTVNGLADSNNMTGAYVVVLSVANSKKRIPVVIDATEAQSIAKKITSMDTPRPLIHEVFSISMRKFDITAEEVLIYKFEEGIFYSRIFFSRGEQHEFVEAKTSDAIAIALIFNCPIFTTSEVVDKAGVILAEDEKYLNSERYCFNLKEADLDALNQLMQNAIDEEDYEYASIIRDEINSRNNKKDKNE